jgi:hypothetical protein
MRKTLDFNSFEQPVLEITMKDDAHTKFEVCAPIEELIEKMEANTKLIEEAVTEGTEETIKAVFTLSAELISFNTEGVRVTAEELRDKYKLKLMDIIIFYGAYMDFISDIKAAKN